MSTLNYSDSSSWPPSASLKSLRVRAQLYHTVRQFFSERQVLEVEVPLLARAAVTDPHLDSIGAEVCGESLYLQTSPEFFMKRLLASGSGDIYSLGKAFRNDEAGSRHNPEFTMLEWYRLGYSDHQLMDEVAALIQSCLTDFTVEISSIEKLSFRQLFERELNIDPHTAELSQLQALAQQYCDIHWLDDDRDVWLDLLMSHVLEPRLGEGLVFVYDYPASQAALARVCEDKQGQRVAKRFEAYLGGMELANGYWELTDSDEQIRRFQRDLQKRQALGLPLYPSDQHLVAALAAGLPDCAGVALGMDRLLMKSSHCNDIRQLISFSFERV